MPSKRARKSTAQPPSPEQFLSTFPPELQALAQELRALVKLIVPNVREAVYPGWRLIGYRMIEKRREVYFCFIAPTPGRVLLGFEYGVLLADPEGLLEGEGNQVRQVTIARPEDIRREALALLIAEAAQVAAAPKELKQQLFVEREMRLEAKKQDLD